MNFKCHVCGEVWDSFFPHIYCPKCSSDKYGPENLEEWSVREGMEQKGPVASCKDKSGLPDKNDLRWIDQNPDDQH